MACSVVKVGGTTFLVKHSPMRKRRCAFCQPGRELPATRLCDFELAPGKTCDAPMCSGCARPVGPDTDLCPNHAAHGAVPAQGSLNFSGAKKSRQA